MHKKETKTNLLTIDIFLYLQYSLKNREKFLTVQLLKYLIDNDILFHNRFGFRQGQSTETALKKILSSIYTSVEENKNSMLSLLDISKAFDRVIHNILLHKLIQYNILIYYNHSLYRNCNAIHTSILEHLNNFFMTQPYLLYIICIPQINNFTFVVYYIKNLLKNTTAILY